jgi:hypothetical protein
VGVLCDYFRAPDRATALALHRHPDGLFEAAASAGTEALDLKGLDPFVILGKLVGLLSGVSYEHMLLAGGIPIDHVPDPVLVTGEDDEDILVELSVVMRDTLADATEAALTEAAPSGPTSKSSPSALTMPMMYAPSWTNWPASRVARETPIR